jgi:heat shock protein HslJ
MFGINKGIATLKECSSQVAFPVSPGGDYNTALQNYMNTPHDMNKSILISILGRLVKPNREELVIEQFRKFYPDSDCQGNKIKTSLTGTNWQVLQIQDRKWSEITDKMAHLLLKRDKTIEGFSGCNKVSGTYLVKGDVLLINRELVSRKACPGGMEGENQLVAVLDDVESYRIEENILELIDQNDQVLARFMAGP